MGISVPPSLGGQGDPILALTVPGQLFLREEANVGSVPR